MALDLFDIILLYLANRDTPMLCVSSIQSLNLSRIDIWCVRAAPLNPFCLLIWAHTVPHAIINVDSSGHIKSTAGVAIYCWVHWKIEEIEEQQLTLICYNRIYMFISLCLWVDLIGSPLISQACNNEQCSKWTQFAISCCIGIQRHCWLNGHFPKNQRGMWQCDTVRVNTPHVYLVFLALTLNHGSKYPTKRRYQWRTCVAVVRLLQWRSRTIFRHHSLQCMPQTPHSLWLPYVKKVYL